MAACIVVFGLLIGKNHNGLVPCWILALLARLLHHFQIGHSGQGSIEELPLVPDRFKEMRALTRGLYSVPLVFFRD